VAKLPTDLSGREVRAALERAGFVFRRQDGNHMVLRRDRPYARVVVPDHKQVRLGTLRRIITDAGLTVEQFMKLLDGDNAAELSTACIAGLWLIDAPGRAQTGIQAFA
jgi:predicted RNA binding protein YcfA (HicA-like mRNA interferase family)